MPCSSEASLLARTTKDGLRVTLVKSSKTRFNLPTPNTFRISGQITNQRGAKDRVVVRVMRNEAAKHKRHRQGSSQLTCSSCRVA